MKLEQRAGERKWRFVRDRQLGGVLIIVGALLLLSSMRGLNMGWIWLAGLGTVFLIAHGRGGRPALAVPAGVLLGLGAGTMLESFQVSNGWAVILGLAGGFLLVNFLEPVRHRWALWPAMVLGAIGALIMIQDNTALIAVALVMGGLFVISGARLRVARPAVAERSVQPTTPARPVAAESADSAVRFDRLGAWRAARAAADNVSAQAVLRDDQLSALSLVAPRSLADLRPVLDERQVLTFGAAILRVLGE